MSARYATFICDSCGITAMLHESDTKLPPAQEPDETVFFGQRESLGICGTVIDGHGGNKSCTGSVEHAGWVTLERSI